LYRRGHLVVIGVHGAAEARRDAEDEGEHRQLAEAAERARGAGIAEVPPIERGDRRRAGRGV
jgi:hypothetical protein